MRELAGFYERTKLDNLLRHLLWGDELDELTIEDFEKELRDSLYEHEVLRAKTRYADLKTQWGDY